MTVLEILTVPGNALMNEIQMSILEDRKLFIIKIGHKFLLFSSVPRSNYGDQEPPPNPSNMIPIEEEHIPRNYAFF